MAPRRNAAGYRIYSEQDLRRVRDVVALKALGLSLSDIRGLLERRTAPLDVLRAQRRSLERKRRSIERAIGVIAEVERAAASSEDRALPALLAEAAWSHAEQKREDAELVPRPADRAGASRIALAHETLAAIDGVGAGRLEELRERWRSMIAREAADHPEVAEQIAKAYANRRSWPRGMRDWAASLYELDLDAFERLARFIDGVGTAPPPSHS